MEILKDEHGKPTSAVMLSDAEFDALMRVAYQKTARRAERAIKNMERRRQSIFRF